MLKVQHASRKAQGTFGLFLARFGGPQFVRSVDHHRGVQRLADFDDGSVREFGSRQQGQASAGLQTVFAVEHQHAFGGQRVADGFGNAFAQPIQVGRVGMVEEGQDQGCFRRKRAAEQDDREQKP